MSRLSSYNKGATRIQREKQELILEAALEVFAANGFRGSTIDQISEAAGMSKPNLLYYFSTKEDIHKKLIERLMDNWLAPLKHINALGDPVEEIRSYIRRKLQMSRDFPRESRLFANEILQGAPRITVMIKNDLKIMVDEKAAIIQGWMDRGKLIQADPRHLLFAIWATSQHYADFDIQVAAVLGTSYSKDKCFDDAQSTITTILVNGLRAN